MTAKHSADNLPSPAVPTFLFTDIEGSTEKWEREPARMAQAVACHDDLMRAAVEAHGGRVVKSTGDGIHAIFADPLDSVRAVIAIQTELGDPAATAGILLMVRCGLHCGEAEIRGNDFFGPTLNRAARIMNAAYGGQALVSHSVAELTGDRLPSDISLRNLGGLRLKGLATPERVYQIIHPSLRDDFPPLRSLEATPNNFPQKLTSFIGRERELMEVAALLRRAGLLTLLGMGGLGKTRLSLQVGTNLMDCFDDGAWFVDLASIRDPSLVASEVAKALGVREEPGRPLVESLCTYLKPRKTLLILDNCEQVITAAAELANAFRAAAPDVRIIATSRELLRVPGEQIYPMLPLPIPHSADGLDALSRSTAVRLFVERAQLHRQSFSLDEHNAWQVGELVARLEGIPLALELAAARVRSLSVADINARLNDRYKLLTGGGRVVERQQTLRALVDWSYDLLSVQEQIMLNRLSIFAGSFDMSAAEQICGVDPLATEGILDLLSSLVDKSLVMNQDGADGTRYRMLETIREYGREKLERARESTAIAARHCEYYFIMAKAANRGLKQGQQSQWTRRMETELDNVRAALALALAGGVDAVIAVKIAVAMQSFWIFGGRVSEGRDRIRDTLDLVPVQASDQAHAFALYVGAALATTQGDYVEARRMLEQCLMLRRGLGNKVDIAAALSTLSWALVHAGAIEPARALEEEAMALFRELGDRFGEAVAHQHLGQICIYAGDNLRAARNHVEQSLAIAREIKHVEIQSECERMLGELALTAGDVAEASRRVADSLALCQEAGDKRGEAIALWWIGKVDLTAGNISSARMRLSGALRLFRDFDMRAEMLECVEDHAALACLDGELDYAARLFGAADSLRKTHGLARKRIAEAKWLAELSVTRERLGDRAFNDASLQGRTWDINEAVRQVL